jgi:suppressor of fused
MKLVLQKNLRFFRGRVSHGRHFTFKSVFSDSAVTLVSPSVTGIFVDTENPYAAHGAWLQMLVPPHVANDMSESLEELSNADQVCLIAFLIVFLNRLTSF